MPVSYQISLPQFQDCHCKTSKLMHNCVGLLLVERIGLLGQRAVEYIAMIHIAVRRGSKSETSSLGQFLGTQAADASSCELFAAKLFKTYNNVLVNEFVYLGV